MFRQQSLQLAQKIMLLLLDHLLLAQLALVIKSHQLEVQEHVLIVQQVPQHAQLLEQQLLQHLQLLLAQRDILNLQLDLALHALAVRVLLQQTHH